jgi:hexosaminidase
MKKYVFLLAVYLSPCVLYAQVLNLIPYPNHVTRLKDNLLLTKNIRFYTDNQKFEDIVDYLNEDLARADKNTMVARQKIKISIDNNNTKPGAYTLKASGKTIRITAADKVGVFYGMVTLSQLYRSAKSDHNYLTLPGVYITDQPRYQWRGFMLDESRHFFGKNVVKNIINWMAFYKLNRFHWHLTDAQGWRFEVKEYPLLATKGGVGNFTDSTAGALYYTQSDIKEIVAFAKRRNIEIIPEIDMPGHATGATSAYPELSGGTTPGYENFTFNPAKETTYKYLSNVLKEVKNLFPAHIIHIGGDEVTLGIKAWETNPEVLKMMAAKNMTDYRQAEFYFLRRIADTVQKLGCSVMCWDEAVPAGLPTANVVVNWWRQNKPESLTEALNKGYKVVLCPRLPLYFDFVQDSTHVSGRKWGKLYNTYLDIYHFPENALADTVYKRTNIIGIQANLWTETVITKKRLEYLLFPRLAAMAEAGWVAQSSKNDELFNKRLSVHLQYYKQAGLYYYDPFHPGYHPEAVDVKPKSAIQD